MTNATGVSMKRVVVTVPVDDAPRITEIAATMREKAREAAQDCSYTPGGDAKAISYIARNYFGGFREMFVHHGWPERGSGMMQKVQSRVTETYGSVKNFERFYSENKG